MKKTIKVEYDYLKEILDLPQGYQDLIGEAKHYATKAQAPYSNFHVGASALLSNAKIISGFNIENAAYPQCMCAEQVMLSNVKTVLGEDKIKAIAIYSPDAQGENPVSPCGSCRQILSEQEFHQKEHIKLIISNQKGNVWIFPSIRSVLPFSFDAEVL